VIAGAGIAGLAAALALHRVGLQPLVLERAPEMREQGSAIALWANAWRALDALGVGAELRAVNPLLLDRFELARSDGRLLRGFDLSQCDAAAGGCEAAEFRGVRRGALLEALLAALPSGCVRFGCGVEAVEGDAQRGPGAWMAAFGNRRAQLPATRVPGLD
jgi:2-polyprenyl-6-methoxyphenol hydroxylase-like FAD-dependent oxidoreductase